jgi:hypothetical protein
MASVAPSQCGVVTSPSSFQVPVPALLPALAGSQMVCGPWSAAIASWMSLRSRARIGDPGEYKPGLVTGVETARFWSRSQRGG